MKIKKSIKSIFSNERFQLIYGISLLVLIPLIITINVIFVINRYNQTIDVSLQRRGLLIGRIFSTLMKDDLKNHDVLQEKITEISQTSGDIIDLKIMIPRGDEFEVIAATKEEDRGKKLNFYYYNLAWQQTGLDALATDSLLLSSVDKQINPEIFERKERFWLVSLPLLDNEKNKVALLSMTLSSQVVDHLASLTWRSSLYSLALSLLIIILFLAVSTRLWKYAELYKKIQEVDEMKDEFISMASHELRTPITSIRGFAEMILDGSLGQVPDQIKSGLEKISGSANRLYNLVEDLLNVSRIEQNRLEFTMEPLKILPLVQSVVDELGVNANKKNITLDFKISPKLPEISADKDKVKQILINIIGNAIKYTEKGSVEIFGKEKNGRLEIIVKDTGIGMSAENQKHLFEKFYRVRNEKTERIVGTGLGLWITKQLTEAMKGTVSVESIQGTGTQVIISFPVNKS